MIYFFGAYYGGDSLLLKEKERKKNPHGVCGGKGNTGWAARKKAARVLRAAWQALGLLTLSG